MDVWMYRWMDRISSHSTELGPLLGPLSNKMPKDIKFSAVPLPCYLVVKSWGVLGLQPQEGTTPVKWGEIPLVHTSIRPYVRHPGWPSAPAGWLSDPTSLRGQLKRSKGLLEGSKGQQKGSEG